MSFYHDFIINPVQNGIQKVSQGIPIPYEKIGKYTNYINRGQTYAIGGKNTSGKTSFMDYTYMINVYKWWKELSYEKYEDDVLEGERIVHKAGDVKYDRDGEPTIIEGLQVPPLKMFYFSMKSRPELKWQKWVCLYLKLRYGNIIDISTLTSGVGKLYDLDQGILDKITEASRFFEEFEEEVLTFVSGKQTPTSINNRVSDYMDSIGSFNDNVYHLDNDHAGQLTFVYVDTVNELRPEMDGYQAGNPESAKKKLITFADDWKNQYNVTTYMVVPSKVTNSRMVRDGEPSYKELGVFADSVDIGLVLYNPYNENNNGYLGYPVNELVVKGKDRIRTITIVRNTGQTNITTGLIFIGECGYFKESPTPSDESGWLRYRQLFESIA